MFQNKYPHISTAVQCAVRCLSTSKCLCSKTSHYDSLGITPKATQADVKAAYYNLSKLHHPDKNDGSEEAVKKFRDISEAYEVLGNVKSRRLYDKGMSIGINIGSTSAPPRRRDPRMEEYLREAREMRAKPPRPGGRQPVYNFDEWSRAHYESTFARDLHERSAYMHHRKNRREMKQASQMEGATVIMWMIVLTILYFSSDSDYDTVRVSKTETSKSDNSKR